MKFICASHSSLLMCCWMHLPVPLDRWIQISPARIFTWKEYSETSAPFPILVLAVPVLAFMKWICLEHLEI